MQFSASGTSVTLLLAGLPDAAWIVDARGVLVELNSAFAAFTRAFMRREAVRGGMFRELVRGTEHEALFGDLTGRVTGGRSVAADARFHDAGLERAYTIHGSPLPEGAFFVAREVTVHHALRDDSLELTLTRLFLTEPTLEDALSQTVAFLCAADEWDAAVVWLVDSEQVLVPRAICVDEAVSHARELREGLQALRFRRGHGVPGRAWAHEEMIWVPDLLDETGLTRADLAMSSGIHSVVAVPMVESGRVVGIVELLDRDVRPISEKRKQSLGRTAGAIGRLVGRRRTEDERRRLLALVERKGNEWALTFDALPQPIFLTDRNGAVIQLNRAACELACARHSSEVLGRDAGSLGEGEPWITLRDAIDAVTGSGQRCQAHAESEDAVFEIEAVPDAEEQRVIVILRETTEMLRLQESVRRGEQLAALGELVAGVAHQVKNPLFGIGMTVDLLYEQVPRDAETAELFAALREWLRRLDRLMESLLAYGKTWTVDLRPSALHGVVEQAMELCRPQAEANGVRLEWQSLGDATILMDPRRLVHAFENVITNAAQHAPRGTAVTVGLSADAHSIEVVVEDRGAGFREEDLPRIFEPFFTRRRGGTGLGLSIVQRIVDEHGGTVSAETGLSGGARVRVRIPRYDEAIKSALGGSDPDRR